MTINYISYWQLALAQVLFLGIVLVAIGITAHLQWLWSKLITHFTCKHIHFKTITINDEKGKLDQIITRCECGHESYYTPMYKLGGGRPKKNSSKNQSK